MGAICLFPFIPWSPHIHSHVPVTIDDFSTLDSASHNTNSSQTHLFRHYVCLVVIMNTFNKFQSTFMTNLYIFLFIFTNWARFRMVLTRPSVPLLLNHLWLYKRHWFTCSGVSVYFLEPTPPWYRFSVAKCLIPGNLSYSCVTMY